MTTNTNQPVTNEDIKRELDDIKGALAKADRNFRRSLWLTPTTVALALVIAGEAAAGFVAHWVLISFGLAMALFSAFVIRRIK